MIPEPIKEYEEEKARYEARNNLLESDNRLLMERIKSLKKNFEIAKKEINKYKAQVSNLKDYIDLEECESCNLLFPTDVMSNVGNERICENCRVNGYGR